MSANGENILQDAASLAMQMNEVNTDVVPPEAFARESKPSAVDYYIGLVDAWKQAEDNEVIEITPTTVSQITKQVFPNRDDDDVELGVCCDEVSIHDLEEKIDATYNKLCSLEQTDEDLVESLTHVNDYLDSIHQQGVRNQIDSTKSIQALQRDVNSLKAGQDEIRTSIKELHMLLKSIYDMNLRSGTE